MKKYQMLEKAMKDYPKGTKFISLFGNEIESSGLFFIDGTDSVAESPSNCNVHQSETGKWAEIVKPKIAVKVENEKEFDALMKYYDSLGWKWAEGSKPSNSLFIPNNYPDFVRFEDEFTHTRSVGYNEKTGYQIIPFADFAKEHDIKLPLLKSEDGVWLYEGDANHVVSNRDGSWGYICHNSTISNDHNVVENPESYKAFITQQAALDWIEAQKPKEIKVKLFGNKKAFICKDKITIDDGKYTFDLFPSDLEDINHYFKELS